MRTRHPMRTLALGLALALLLAPAALAQEDAGGSVDPDTAAIEKAVQQRIKIKPTKLAQPALAAVFTAVFYKVEVRVHNSGGWTSNSLKLAMNDGKVADFEEPTTNMAMPQLQALLRSDLVLNDETAKQVQAALDAIWPVSFSSDKKVMAIRKEAGQWVFVRGTFFKKRKGFVFKVDADGKVTELRYSLGLPAEEAEPKKDAPEKDAPEKGTSGEKQTEAPKKPGK